MRKIKELLFLLIILLLSVNSFADRKKLSLESLKNLYPDAAIGMSMGYSNECYKVFIFRSNFDVSSENQIRVCGPGLKAKPTEHFEKGKLYLFFSRKEKGKRILGRLVEISNLNITKKSFLEKNIDVEKSINALDVVSSKK